MHESQLWLRQIRAHSSNYSQKPRTQTQAIVLHCTDGHEGPTKAEDCGAMIALPLAKPRSPHAVVDSDSAVQCVPWDLIAYHCGHTGNSRCEGIEICGFAKQTREEWFDAFSLPSLCRAARLVAMRCAARAIPVAFVDRVGLRAGLRGITTHAEVSAAWLESKHTDPGLSFPTAEFIQAVRVAMGAA